MKKKRTKQLTFRQYIMYGIIIGGGIFASCDTEDYSISETVTKPITIIDVDPKEGLAGDVVAITGTNFSALGYNNKVRFNGKLARVLRVQISDETEIAHLFARIPSNATLGPVTLSHKTFSDTTSYDFKPIPSVYLSTPSLGRAGTTVVLKGTGFSDDVLENKVWFEGVVDPAIINESTANTMSVVVPDGAQSGPIRLEVKDQPTTSTVNFTVSDIETMSLTIPITSDAEEAEGHGIVAVNSSDLEFGTFDISGTPDNGNQTIGLGFNSLEIPRNATIISAVIQFIADVPGIDPTEMTFYAEKNAHPSDFDSNTLFNISEREKTSASVAWRIAPWLFEGDMLEAQRTVNLASIVQEIVDLPDWTQGNTINFIVNPSGSSVYINRESSNMGRIAKTIEFPIISEQGYPLVSELYVEYYLN